MAEIQQAHPYRGRGMGAASSGWLGTSWQANPSYQHT